jgi:hypothetical protein
MTIIKAFAIQDYIIVERKKLVVYRQLPTGNERQIFVNGARDVLNKFDKR